MAQIFCPHDLAHRPPHENYHYTLANVAVDIASELYQKNLKIPQTIIEALKHAAELSDTSAMIILGILFYDGRNVEKNLEKAFDWFQRAAELGNSVALVNLGVCYHAGKGVELDFEKAVELYQHAVKIGSSQAMINLAWCYQKGEGIEQNLCKSIELYQHAVDLGSSQAMVNLARCYQKGEGIKQNLCKSIELYQHAIELGSNQAMVNLAWCYQKGEGIEQNLDEAIKLYRLAIKLGDSEFSGVNYYLPSKGIDQSWNKNLYLNEQPEKLTIEDVTNYLNEALLLKNFLSPRIDKIQKDNTWLSYGVSRSAMTPPFDPPFMSGDWMQLTAEEITDFLDKIFSSFVILELVEKLNGYIGQYARILPLGFYKNCNLVDVQLYNPTMNDTLLFSAIINSGHAILLTGKSNIIHGLNAHLLNFNNQKFHLDYLSFFCSYIHGDQGPFQIISTFDEIPFDQEIDQSFLDKIKSSFFIPKYIEGNFEKDGWQKFESFILYGKALFDSVFKVFSDGMVTMENEECIFSNLPVLQRQYKGLFRKPLGSDNLLARE